MVERYGFQDFASVTFEAGCSIMYLQSGNETHVFRSEVGHQDTPHGPVHNVDPADVAGTDGNIVPFFCTGIIETGQVVGVVRKVCVHLEYIIIAVLDGPLESGDIGGAQSQLPFALDHEQALGKLTLQAAHDGCCSVG